MPLHRTGYDLQFEDIGHGNPALGRAAILPWDTAIFGFPVASFQVGAGQLDGVMKMDFPLLLLSWMEKNQVLLCASTIPAGDSWWKLCLPEAGFRFVDFAMQATLQGLQAARLPEARTELRLAEAPDWQLVEDIAARSFCHGRYHADPEFPQELADRRYQRWIRSALSGENGSDRVFVMGEHGQVQGFYHLTIDGYVADLRLAAVTRELQGTMLAFDLYVSILHKLKASGVRRVVTSFSAANSGVLNIYSMLGFRFSEPEAIYHWHAAGLKMRTESK